MEAESFATWLRRQGLKVVRTTSSYWVESGPRVYQAFPYHWIIQPLDGELHQFLKENKAIGLRYSTPIHSMIGCVSYHVVYNQTTYDLENLGKWARKNVRRGLNHCNVEPISFERLAEEGWSLQLDTLDRQGRRLSLDREVWRRRCISASDLPGFEAWGAIIQGSLAASMITFQMGNCCYMLYQQCLREYLIDHVNNALGFTVTREMVRRPQIETILYGLHSLDAPASVDEFKFRMGYTAKPVRQRVVFNPWLRPLFTSTSHALLQAGLRLYPDTPTLSKAEGMLRFYLQGRLPLSEQTIPPPLVRETLTDVV